jgi:hypothetical protein
MQSSPNATHQDGPILFFESHFQNQCSMPALGRRELKGNVHSNRETSQATQACLAIRWQHLQTRSWTPPDSTLPENGLRLDRGTWCEGAPQQSAKVHATSVMRSRRSSESAGEAEATRRRAEFPPVMMAFLNRKPNRASRKPERCSPESKTVYLSRRSSPIQEMASWVLYLESTNLANRSEP